MRKNQNKRITDLLADPQFVEWVRSADSNLDLYWNRWIENYPDQVQEFEKAKEIARSLAISDEPADLYDFKHESLVSILKSSPSIKANRTIQPDSSQSLQKYLTKIAAIIVVGLGLAFVSYWLVKEPEPKVIAKAEVIIKENPNGQKIKFQLPDKSIVWLNSNSRLMYPQYFNQDRRSVKLFGEAFFEIEHNTSKPFDVVVGDLVTTALGTSFNIRSFPEEGNEVEVSLVTGKVKVSNKDKGKENLLSPGEQVVYNKNNKEMIVRNFSLKEVTSWKDGILFFKNNSYEEVKRELEKWYGVNIKTIGQPKEEWSLNGEFKNQSVERVLERIAFAKSFTFSIEKKSITIKF